MINPNRTEDRRDRIPQGQKPTAIATRGRAPAAKPPKESQAIAVREKPKTEFEKYERIVFDSFSAAETNFMEGCKAVGVILTRHLYRQIGYDTFDECCEQRWGWSARRGYQYAAANATLKLLPKRCVPLVQNERQVRALSEVKETKREAVLGRIVESGEPVTARAITTATKPGELKKKSAPKVIDVTPEPEKVPFVKHCATCTCE